MGLFPDQNPNPVLRLAATGHLVYANAAAAPITSAWGVSVGDRLADDVARALQAAAAASPPGRVEVVAGGRTFDVLAIHVAELEAWNLYGTDITAEKVVERFPGSNPNPVLRMTPGGRVCCYGNNASATDHARRWRLEVGAQLPSLLLESLRACLADATAPTPRSPARAA